MFILQSYPLAVIFCVITMFCWGSWANTQKLARKGWRFELFYWDYTIGVLLLTLVLGLTLGSSGHNGRSFLADLSQASHSSILSALIGGAIFKGNCEAKGGPDSADREETDPADQPQRDSLTKRERALASSCIVRNFGSSCAHAVIVPSQRQPR